MLCASVMRDSPLADSWQREGKKNKNVSVNKHVTHFKSDEILVADILHQRSVHGLLYLLHMCKILHLRITKKSATYVRPCWVQFTPLRSYI